MRVLIVGNSGAGKSWQARAFAQEHGLAHLDLDTIYWEAGQVAVARPMADVLRDLRAFMDAHPAWVAEGCYGDVVEAALPFCTELVFMNPGREQCLANCRARPWEPHKYASKEQQDSMLPFLLDWVAQYYERDDPMSYAAHRRLFDAFGGAKRELARQGLAG
jgi:adenylate kinase family enzyme